MYICIVIKTQTSLTQMFSQNDIQIGSIFRRDNGQQYTIKEVESDLCLVEFKWFNTEIEPNEDIISIKILMSVLNSYGYFKIK